MKVINLTYIHKIPQKSIDSSHNYNLNSANSQTYQLYITLNKDQTLQIGKLGAFFFPKGSYIYTGSAKRAIDARIARHMSKTKKLHWHIDYFLDCKATTITETKKFNQNECTLNQENNGKAIVKGFGSSDCTSGCDSHLIWVGS